MKVEVNEYYELAARYTHLAQLSDQQSADQEQIAKICAESLLIAKQLIQLSSTAKDREIWIIKACQDLLVLFSTSLGADNVDAAKQYLTELKSQMQSLGALTQKSLTEEYQDIQSKIGIFDHLREKQYSIWSQRTGWFFSIFEAIYWRSCPKNSGSYSEQE